MNSFASYFRINWYIKHPQLELQPDYFLRPFDIKLWSILISTVIIGSILLIFSLVKNRTVFLIDDAFISFESFCNQNGSDDVKNISSRIICIALRMTSMVLTLSFGAVITSFFSAQIPKVPFSDLQEFFQNGEYKLEIYRGSVRLILVTENLFFILCGKTNFLIFPVRDASKTIKIWHRFK